MTADNVIWGTDFRGEKAFEWFQEYVLQSEEMQRALMASRQHLPDTTPSEYTAPSDDCA